MQSIVQVRSSLPGRTVTIQSYPVCFDTARMDEGLKEQLRATGYLG